MTIMSIMLKNINKNIKLYAKHLINTYPILGEKKLDCNLENIFHNWYDNITQINYSINFVKNTIIAASGKLSLTSTREDINKYLLPKLTRNQKIFIANQLEDLPFVKFGADFYNKSIDEYVDDFYKIFDQKLIPHTIRKHNNELFMKTFIHLTKCEILFATSRIFYYLKIAIIIENIYISHIDEISMAIVDMAHDRTNFSYALFTKDYYDKDELELYFKRFYNDHKTGYSILSSKLNILFDIFRSSIKLIENMDTHTFNKFNSSCPKNKKASINKKNQLSFEPKILFLVPYFCNTNDNDDKDEIRDMIKPNLIHISNRPLVIEI